MTLVAKNSLLVNQFIGGRNYNNSIETNDSDLAGKVRVLSIQGAISSPDFFFPCFNIIHYYLLEDGILGRVYVKKTSYLD